MTTPRKAEFNGISIPHDPELAKLQNEITDGLPPGSCRDGAKGGPVRSGGKGNHGRWIGEKFISADEIIESIRDLLANSWTSGDIKRVMAKRFGGSGRSFERHLRAARKRNLEHLCRTPYEAKADSMQQWQRLLVEAKQDKSRTHANLLAAQTELNALRMRLADGGLTDDQTVTIHARIDAKYGQVQTAEKSYSSARYWLDKFMNTIDVMLGTRAPVETTTRISAEVKQELAHPTEPLTAAESDKLLLDLLAQVRGELAGEIKQKVSVPSGN